MAVPEPAFTFTIPSIHDDTPLDCRIYHPTVLFDAPTTGSCKWPKKGAVIAHPYAPLGGSYDDHVVAMVADELLKEGFVVGTFNFRGAHGSKGRTSWTGKPELDDYVSFAGFLIHYLDLLCPPTSPNASTPTTPSTSTLSAEDYQLKEKNLEKGETLLILAGYSYGSLITKHLPPTSTILSHFSLTTAGSAAAEILLRAHNLSSQRNRDLDALSRTQHKKNHSHDHHPPVKMGGEETSPTIRRSSREIRRSSEHGRSLDLSHSIRSLSLRRRKRDEHEREHGLAVIESRVSASASLSASPSTSTSAPPATEKNEAENIPATSTAYLLISTVPPPLSTLMIPAIGHKFWNKHKDHHGDNIVRRPTLAVFGGCDGFVAVKKYRQWASRLKVEPGSRFEYHEVAGAGHFWHEDGVDVQLRDAVRRWVGGLVDTR